MRDFDAIKKKEMSSIENRIRHIYNVGYEDCLKDQQKVKDEAYKHGLEDAWECCKRFWQSDENTCRDIFNIICWEDFFDLSPSEAIEKFKEYDDKHNCIERCCKNCKHSENGMVGSTERCESCYYDRVSRANTLFEPMEKDNSNIEVGDEIISGDAHVVVTWLDEYGNWNGMLVNECEEGHIGCTYSCMSGFRGWRKTNKRYPKIAEVLGKKDDTDA